MAHEPAQASNRQWDVALSFAGEQRPFVSEVAEESKSRGFKVFYDDFEKVALWGKDLYEHLSYIYRDAARYCVLFVSEAYAEKVWTTLERRSAQARALEENGEYVLPARFDATEVPGLLPTVAYIDIREMSSADFADLLAQKLGSIKRETFFPPNPDRLFEALSANDEEEQEWVVAVGHAFMQTLGRMSIEERKLVGTIFRQGCPAELPDNIHISLDLLRRETAYPPVQALQILQGIRSLGFELETRESEEVASDDELVVLSWNDMTPYDDETFDYATEYSTAVAVEMMSLANSYCTEHALDAIERMDFSVLSSALSHDHE